MHEFAAGERRWVERFGNLRNTVRQELIGRQLEQHVCDPVSVVDVGCGQGTQAIRLARRGCRVVGVDPSAALLEQLASDARAAGVDIDRRRGSIGDLEALLGGTMFEVVCAHGVLMYLDDPQIALDQLIDLVAPGGLLSVTFRNAGALAFRPGMRGEWQAAVAAFEATTYTNELGVHARADHLDDVTSHLSSWGLDVEAWYGVRVFTDPLPGDEDTITGADLQWLLRAEEQAGSRDPYRRLGSQIHVLARRSANR